MTAAVEELVLRFTGDSKSGEEAIQRVQKAWSGLGRYLQQNKDQIRPGFPRPGLASANRRVLGYNRIIAWCAKRDTREVWGETAGCCTVGRTCDVAGADARKRARPAKSLRADGGRRDL